MIDLLVRVFVAVFARFARGIARNQIQCGDVRYVFRISEQKHRQPEIRNDPHQSHQNYESEGNSEHKRAHRISDTHRQGCHGDADCSTAQEQDTQIWYGYVQQHAASSTPKLFAEYLFGGWYRTSASWAVAGFFLEC